MTHKSNNQLNLLSEFGQWHLVAFFSQIMISVEIWYKTYNQEFLAIVEIFKTWCHYLDGCKYKVLVLIDYNNLCQFINTKNLSSCQVKWGWELSCYYFRINYCQDKGHEVADALSSFLQRFTDKEMALQISENMQIFYCLQFSLTKASLLGFSFSNHKTGLLP